MEKLNFLRTEKYYIELLKTDSFFEVDVFLIVGDKKTGVRTNRFYFNDSDFISICDKAKRTYEKYAFNAITENLF